MKKRYQIILCIGAFFLFTACANQTMQENITQEVTKIECVSLPKITLKEEIRTYKNITYGEFKEKYGDIAEFYHADRFLADIPKSSIMLEFFASSYDENFVYQLSDEDTCGIVHGLLMDMADGIYEEMSVKEFAKALTWNEDVPTKYAIEEGAGTAYYIADIYAVFEFDSDGDAVYDTKLLVCMDESDGVEPEAITWVCPMQ